MESSLNIPPRIVFLRGLPGSGKTTYAKDLIKRFPGEYKRVCKDDLREMIDNGEYEFKSEKLILKVRDHIIRESLEAGKIVIVDDTNLSPTHLKTIESIAKGYVSPEGKQCAVDVIDFTTSIEECVQNDAKRVGKACVGEKVIRRMAKQYNWPDCKKDFWLTIPNYNNLPMTNVIKKRECVIVDIDGTLAIHNGRNVYDWKRVGEDLPNQKIINLLSNYMSMYSAGKTKENRPKIFFVSGRDGICMKETKEWLKKYVFPSLPKDIEMDLIMREPRNQEKDSVIKKRAFQNYIKPDYEVLFVLDDRDQVVEMWREEGLTCLQVAKGDF